MPFSMSTFLLVGVPSSSILRLPQAFCMVPSSTAVTMSEAIFSPSFPANTDAFLATAVASRPWPQASWNITPPKPLSITTVILPEGHSSALSIVTAVFAACFESSLMSILSKSSKPSEPPGLILPLCFSFPSPATASVINLVLTLLSLALSPSLFTINTSCTLSA